MLSRLNTLQSRAFGWLLAPLAYAYWETWRIKCRLWSWLCPHFGCQIEDHLREFLYIQRFWFWRSWFLILLGPIAIMGGCSPIIIIRLANLSRQCRLQLHGVFLSCFVYSYGQLRRFYLKIYVKPAKRTISKTKWRGRGGSRRDFNLKFSLNKKKVGTKYFLILANHLLIVARSVLTIC